LSAIQRPVNRHSEKYVSWAKLMFEGHPTLEPKFKEPIYFWATAWTSGHIGIWEQLGPTSLAFLEYLLIGVAGRLSPDLLNREGVGRRN
jgi:hypothetical protein